MITLQLAISIWGRIVGVPLLYWLVWCSFVTLSGLLIVLMRTRWGQTRPLHRCAVLSMLVHVLLAGLAMTVRIVVGDEGPSAGPAIQVRILQEPAPADVALASPTAPPIDPPELLPTSAPAAEETRPDEPAESNNLPVPEVIDSAVPPPALVGTQPAAAALSETTLEPDADTPTTEALSSMEDAAATADAPERQANEWTPTRDQAVATRPELESDNTVSPRTIDQPAPPASAAPPAANSAAVAAAVSEAASPPLPAAYSLRADPNRLSLVQQQGGNQQTEAAVAAALQWLAEAQSPDGRWDSNRFGAGQERAVLGHNRQGAGRDADTGISALALLAFLGAGHTHLHGDYQRTVERGLDFLLRLQAADGSLFGKSTLYAQTYCHSMATFALAEALAMTGDTRLEAGVARAVGFSVRSQHRATGGWRYRAEDMGDTSQLGWQMMALASAERAGMEVPPTTWSGIDRFLRSVRRGNFGGLASYMPVSGATTSMTAEALYCRLLLEEANGTQLDEPAAAEATRQILASLPDSREINLYYWYYASLALHHRHLSTERSVAAWQTWNSAMTRVLLDAQVSSGAEAGSWSPNTVWGGYGGRVYSTALAALCLEVYYRYAPLRRDEWIATRPDEAASH